MFTVARFLRAVGVRYEAMHSLAYQAKPMSTTATSRQQEHATDTPDTSRQHPTDLHESQSDHESSRLQYNVDDFKHLMKDPSDAKRIHLILLEHAERETLGQMPRIIEDKHMIELMSLKVPRQRSSYFTYMFKREMSSVNEKAKKERRRLEMMSREKQPTKFSHSIFPLVRDGQELLYYNWRLASAALFGQKLVFDCSFEDSMRTSGLNSLCTQLQLVTGLNKVSRTPFDIILSDIPKGGTMDVAIDKWLPQMNTRKCLITKSYDSYLDLFPRKHLLYLTPDSNNIIEKLDPEAVLIMGGIVDLSSVKPLSLAKAKQQGIRHGKLPLGQYVPEFRIGSSKAFGIHVIADILLTLKETNDWKKAFTKIPSRFTYNIRKTSRKMYGG